MWGNLLGLRGFSLYDIEQFLKEAGSDRISESAIVTLEKELEDTVKELVEEAEVYANYAGRRMIHRSDVELVSNGLTKKRKIVLNGARRRAPIRNRNQNHMLKGAMLP